jgi:hypothetical protein
VNAAITGQQPAEQLSVETVRAAIQLGQFYLNQVQLIHSEGDAIEGDLAPSYCKILSLSQRKGWISARDIYRARAMSDRKTALAQIRGLMQELVAMRLAEARNAGIHLEIRAFNLGDKSAKSGDKILDRGDKTQNVGDNFPTVGDKIPNGGDNSEISYANGWSSEKSMWASSEVGDNFITALPNGSTASEIVFREPSFVTTLSPERKPLKAYSAQGCKQNGANFVTTDSYQTPQARPPNVFPSVIRVGDICRYRGPDGAMNVTCWGKDLHILAIEDGIATVKADQWVHTHQIKVRCLRKI